MQTTKIPIETEEEISFPVEVVTNSDRNRLDMTFVGHAQLDMHWHRVFNFRHPALNHLVIGYMILRPRIIMSSNSFNWLNIPNIHSSVFSLEHWVRTGRPVNFAH